MLFITCTFLHFSCNYYQQLLGQNQKSHKSKSRGEEVDGGRKSRGEGVKGDESRGEEVQINHFIKPI